MKTAKLSNVLTLMPIETSKSWLRLKLRPFLASALQLKPNFQLNKKKP